MTRNQASSASWSRLPHSFPVCRTGALLVHLLVGLLWLEVGGGAVVDAFGVVAYVSAFVCVCVCACGVVAPPTSLPCRGLFCG